MLCLPKIFERFGLSTMYLKIGDYGSASKELVSQLNSNLWFDVKQRAVKYGLLWFKLGTIYNDFTHIGVSDENNLLQTIKYVNSDYCKRFKSNRKLITYRVFNYDIRSSVSYIVDPESADIIKTYYSMSYSMLVNNSYAHIVGITTKTNFVLVHPNGSLEPITFDMADNLFTLSDNDIILLESGHGLITTMKSFEDKLVMLPIPNHIRSHFVNIDDNVISTHYRTDNVCGCDFILGKICSDGTVSLLNLVDGDAACSEFYINKRLVRGLNDFNFPYKLKDFICVYAVAASKRYSLVAPVVTKQGVAYA